MAGGLKDKMSMGDHQIRIMLNCARCGKPVASGESHTCEEEKANEGGKGSSNPDSA